MSLKPVMNGCSVCDTTQSPKRSQGSVKDNVKKQTHKHQQHYIGPDGQIPSMLLFSNLTFDLLQTESTDLSIP